MALLRQTHPAVPIRAVHLDLKGFPPLPDRLRDWLGLAAGCGYNALLVEWEDQFPWTVDERFRGPTCYRPDEIRAVVEEAGRVGLEVIPLVQCLGHLEMALRHDDYAHLRELPDAIDLLNPLAPGARPLIQRLVDDVLALMPNVRRFHLGGDEAWQFGSHPDTRAFVERHGKANLFLHHVEPLLDALASRGIRPMLWHDMLIEWEADALRQVGQKADLVVWGYQGDPENTKDHYHVRYIQRFADAGVPLWGATAYKGADGMDGDLPDPAKRQENALAWVRHGQRFGMQGLIATAWSRYSTGRVQCDPTDASLDCMALVGAILHDGEPPTGGIETARNWIVAADRPSGFPTCHAAVSRFAEKLKAGWALVRIYEGQAWLSTHDPSRDARLPMAYLRNQSQRMQAAIKETSERVCAALAEQMDRRWAREYAQSRSAPLLAHLQRIDTAQ